jgi:hypothetical protein
MGKGLVLLLLLAFVLAVTGLGIALAHEPDNVCDKNPRNPHCGPNHPPRRGTGPPGPACQPGFTTVIIAGLAHICVEEELSAGL